ncbi:ABC transporter ATP-binding protein [Corynebacterium choanae]|uniref:Multidrug export ATP-binding/permease protein n=1 Tax=Corynebacterium choanae TaxID=1862358 RepID=A0A3G6J674_9CORY|nr:ABC transporter ATP-binding protein [Corynebacterium choanae]AZA13273.1 Putative multidrug export ATP-binding/permease protein [Corynebacterium choanae]
MPHTADTTTPSGASAAPHKTATSGSAPTHTTAALRALSHLLLAAKGSALLALATTVVTTVMTAVIPLLTKDAVNIAIGAAEPSRLVEMMGFTQPIFAVMTLLIVASVIRFGFSFLRRVSAGRLSITVQHQVRQEMLKRIMHLDGRALATVRTGQLASRSISDISSVQGLVAMLPLSVENGLTLIVTASIMLYLSPPLALVAIAFLPLITLFAVRRSGKLFAANWSAQQAVADFATKVENTITGFHVVKAFAAETREVHAARDLARTVFAEKIRAATISARIQPLVSNLPQLMHIANLAVGGYLVMTGRLDIGTFVAFAAYMTTLASSTRMVAATAVRINQSLASVSRIMEVLALRPSLPQPAAPASIDPDQPLGLVVDRVSYHELNRTRDHATTDTAQTLAPAATVSTPSPDDGKTTISDQARRRQQQTQPGDSAPAPRHRAAMPHAAYGSGSTQQLLLDEVSFTLDPGTFTVMVGPAQAGKTMLVALLSRLYDPTSGRIALTVGQNDSPNRKTYPYLAIGSQGVRRHVAFMFDDPQVFSGSVRDNIAMGRPVDDEAIRWAATIAGAMEFIAELPEGFDTLLGEKGRTLSGGQRQRLALARTLVTRPALIVLDDATSAIDAITEASIYQQLRSALPETTVLAITHRHSTVALADAVVVMDQGRVVATGPTAEVINHPRFLAVMATAEEQHTHTNVRRSQPRLASEQPESKAAAVPYANPSPSLPHQPLTDRPRQLLHPAQIPTDASDLLWQQLWPPQHAPSKDTRNAHRMNKAQTRAAVTRTGGGMGGHRPPGAAMTPATDDLLHQVEHLPPARAIPRLSPAAELADVTDVGRFSLPLLLSRARWLLLATTVLLFASVACDLAFPYLVRFTIDGPITTGSTTRLQQLCGVAVVLLVVAWACEVASTLTTARTGERLLYSLRVRLFAHIHNQTTDFFLRYRTGALLTRLTADVESLSTFLQVALAETIVAITTLVGVAVMLGATSLPLAAVALAQLPFVVLATFAFRRVTKKNYAQARSAITEVNTYFLEAVGGVRVLQSLQAETYVANQFSQRTGRYRHLRNRGQVAIALYFPGIIALGELATATVVGVGAWWVQQSTISAGVLVAFVLYMSRLFGPVRMLSQLFDSYSQARVGLGRIEQLLADTPTFRNLDPLELDEAALRDAEQVAAAAATGRIVVDDVSFAYRTRPQSSSPVYTNTGMNQAEPAESAPQRRNPTPPVVSTTASADAPAQLEQPWVLRNVSLTLIPGQTVAIVGATGAGKSTFAQLIAGLYRPQTGIITAGGVDITTFASPIWRRQLGIVPQDPHIFAGTIAEAIAYGKPDATAQEIMRAAARVGALSIIADLPCGMYTMLGDGGSGVSSGTRQLIALARAELINPKLVIYDEATAVVDPATEQHIVAAQRDVAAGRTAIMIAHRLHTAMHADRVIVFHQGRIVEDGTPQQLRAAGGRFAAMLQASAHDNTVETPGKQS